MIDTRITLACFLYIASFLGHQIEELRGKVRNPTLRKFEAYETQLQEMYRLSALDTLFLLYYWKEPVRKLAAMYQVSYYTINKIFSIVGVPRLTSAEATKRYQKSRSPEDIEKDVKRLNATHTSKQRSEWMRKYMASLTPERRREMGKRGGIALNARLTPEQRSENSKKAQASLTPEQRSEIARKRQAAIPFERRSEIMRKVQSALTLEQRREMARKLNASLSPEKKRQRAINARLAAELRPNGIETHIITILQELGIYAETATTALAGQIYYTEHKKENKRHVKLRDGRTAFPDFKVKGHKRVIEIFGDYWHSRAVIKAKGDPEYKCDTQKMIDEYKAVGYEAIIFWEKDLKDYRQKDAIKQALRYFSIGDEGYKGLLKVA